jgi:signal transduction histidine kinase
VRTTASEARARRSLSIITGGFALAIVFTLGSAWVAGREISRRERVQEELAQRNREVTEAYIELDHTRKEQIAAKDSVLSHVSHELRTPLNAIYQFTSILQDRIAGPLTAEQNEYLGIVSRNVQQLQRMIDDVLEATRAQTGKLTYESKPIDVAEVAGDLVRVVRSRAGEKDLRITIAATDSPVVRADPARVRQVLTNLLDNAVKFTPDGGSIAIEVSRDPGNPGFVRTSVRDSGPGLDRESAKRVFERLYQAGDQTDSSRKGLGLGLYICRELITAMGGRLWVETAPGAGATFSFILPGYAPDSDRRG